MLSAVSQGVAVLGAGDGLMERTMTKGNEAQHPRNQKRVIRLQVILNSRELAAIDDFWMEMRLPTRAAAVRHLLARGLSVQDPAAPGPQPRRS
jgi:hypothetical protein